MTQATMTATEAARELGVHESTMRLWIRQGHVIPDGRTVGGHARFTLATVRRLRKRLFPKN